MFETSYKQPKTSTPHRSHLLLHCALLKRQCGEAVDEAKADYTPRHLLTWVERLVQPLLKPLLSRIGDVHIACPRRGR